LPSTDRFGEKAGDPFGDPDADTAISPPPPPAADPFGAPPVAPSLPTAPSHLPQTPASLARGAELETMFRSADLGVRDPTLDDAGRIAALRRFGLAKLDRARLTDLINQVRSS